MEQIFPSDLNQCLINICSKWSGKARPFRRTNDYNILFESRCSCRSFETFADPREENTFSTKKETHKHILLPVRKS